MPEEPINPFGSTPGEITSYKKGVQAGLKHAEPSQKTKQIIKAIRAEVQAIQKGLEENNKEHKQLIKIQDSHNQAIFGDGNGDIGMKKKIDELHATWTQTGFTGKVIIKAFAALGIITGAIVGLIELIKRIK